MYKKGAKLRKVCEGYDFHYVPNLKLDEHVQLMAEIIFQSLQNPEQGRNSHAVLEGIPKLKSLPGIDKKQAKTG